MPEEKKGSQDPENGTSYFFRFQFVKMLKEKLRSITEDQKETDPEEIKSIVYLLKKYGYTSLPPKEFEEENFLDRFYLNHSLGPYKYKGKFGRYFALWKKRNDPKLKPFKQLAYVTFAMIVGFLCVIFNHIAYAGEQKNVYVVQRYAEDGICILSQHITAKEKLFKSVDNEKIILKQIPEQYRGKIYLPINILQNSVNYQCYEMIKQEKELYVSSFYEENQWISILIKVGETSLSLNYKLGDDDLLQNDICIWNNSQIYYNKVTGVTNIIFEIDNVLYITLSNIPKNKLIEIINQMEVYK